MPLSAGQHIPSHKKLAAQSKQNTNLPGFAGPLPFPGLFFLDFVLVLVEGGWSSILGAA